MNEINTVSINGDLVIRQFCGNAVADYKVPVYIMMPDYIVHFEQGRGHLRVSETANRSIYSQSYLPLWITVA